MKKLVFGILCFCISFLGTIDAKGNDFLSGKLPYINISSGLMNYQGDLAFVKDVGYFYNPGLGFDLGLSYVLWDQLGVELNTFGGRIRHEQNSTFIQHNFNTIIVGTGLNISYHFDNGYLLPKGNSVAPYIVFGIAPYLFYPYGDLKHDELNLQYYYWTDGTIRSTPERSVFADQATILERDYDFETSYRSKNADIEKFIWNARVGLGIKFKVNSFLLFNLRSDYCFTNTDYLDGVKIGQGKDGYYYTSIGFIVDPNILKLRWAEKGSGGKDDVDDIDADDFLSLDSDGDGVPDLKDKCSGTLKGVKVDAFGCASERDTAIGVDSMAMMPDSMVVLRELLCKNYPILCGESDAEYPEVNERSKRKKEEVKAEKPAEQGQKPQTPAAPVNMDETIQKIVKIADVDGNGKVDLPELYQAIEEFFDEGDKLNLDEIRQLIDHFFDQY